MDTCALCKRNIPASPEAWTLPSGEVVHIDSSPMPTALVWTSVGTIEICEPCYLQGLPPVFSTPVVAEVHYQFGLAYRDLGRSECSAKALKKALHLCETADILAAIAYAEGARGNRDAAIAHYERALSLDATHFMSLENLRNMREEND